MAWRLFLAVGGRASRDSDYASLVEYLLSPEAEFVQGQVIAATGGTGVIG